MFIFIILILVILTIYVIKTNEETKKEQFACAEASGHNNMIRHCDLSSCSTQSIGKYFVVTGSFTLLKYGGLVLILCDQCEGRNYFRDCAGESLASTSHEVEL